MITPKRYEIGVRLVGSEMCIRDRVIAAYCSTFGHCVFEPPFGAYGERTMFILSLIHI